MDKLDKIIRERIDRAILEVLSDNPYKSKRISSQKHKGKRIFRVGNYRIIFAICEECKKFRFNESIRCKGCKKHGSSDVMLFAVSHRSIIYKSF